MVLFGDGTIYYWAYGFIKVEGKKVYKVSVNKVKELVSGFYKINYFSLENHCESSITDIPTTETSIIINGRIKSLSNYYGAP